MTMTDTNSTRFVSWNRESWGVWSDGYAQTAREALVAHDAAVGTLGYAYETVHRHETGAQFDVYSVDADADVTRLLTLSDLHDMPGAEFVASFRSTFID